MAAEEPVGITDREIQEPAGEAESYDYVIIGTGLSETAIGSILASSKQMKILHIDTSSTYGSEFSTLNFSQLLSHFGQQDSTNVNSTDASNSDVTIGDPINDALIAKNRHFNIDLTPKLLLHESPMKNFLVNNNIHDIVTFTSIKASYFYTDRLHAVPTNEAQSMKSSALGVMEKYRMVKFFWNARKYYDNKNINMKRTMLEEFKSFGLNTDSMDFIGHAVALNLDDRYLSAPPTETYSRILRYAESIVSYEGTESPYIYPMYGLSELCQAFVRKSALAGTIFMLNAKIEDIGSESLVLVDPNGDRHIVKPKAIISDPKYWPGSVVEKEIIRCIMILRKKSQHSRNIIFLKKYLGRQNDVFCVVLGSDEFACPPEYEIGIISTLRENNSEPEEEIRAVMNNFDIIKSFVEIRSVFKNSDYGNVYFTRNVDESAQLDNIYDDITDVCKKLGIVLGQE